jgi:anthranilate synthase component I
MVMLSLVDLYNKEFNCFPLVKELQLDTLNPISAYLKVKSDKHSFLFESVVNEKMGRYSFIGMNPRKVLHLQGDPLVVIEKELSGIKQFQVQGLPDFTGIVN